jgi:hypothetical protein
VPLLVGEAIVAFVTAIAVSIPFRNSMISLDNFALL